MDWINHDRPSVDLPLIDSSAQTPEFTLQYVRLSRSLTLTSSRLRDPEMVRKGETIITEEPFVFVLHSASKSRRCDHCFSMMELKKCSKCQYVHYCSRNCQKLSWTLHKLECENLGKISPKILPDSAHLMIRILLRLQMKNSSTGRSSRPFEDLMSHVSEIADDKRRLEHFATLAMVLRSFFGEAAPDDNLLLEIFGKMCINSFNIMDDDMNCTGTGIYLNASRINHSCDPNAVAVFEGTSLHIRAIEDIPEFNWNLVRISYIDTMNTPSQRKKELQSLYYFICDCPRCSNPQEEKSMNSMTCSNKECDGYVYLNENTVTGRCESCLKETDEGDVKRYMEIVELSDHHIQNMKNKNIAYLDVCNITLSKQKGILHDLNIRKIKTLDLAFEACIGLQRWNDALSYGTKLLPGFRHYYGQYHPLVGLLCMKILKLILLKDDPNEARAYYLQAHEIISITHGVSHPLYNLLQEYYCH